MTPWTFGWRIGLLACLVPLSGWVGASGLQVTPTTLSLKDSRNADGLTLSNTADGVLHVQVRVYHWSQDAAGDQLLPSRGLVISPPMLEVASRAEQLIRVIRTVPPPNGASAVEDAYRLSIDELPVGAPAGSGLQFVVHYSLPIFVEPVGAKDISPDLHWTLCQDGPHAVLQVSNGGNGHAQLATLSFTDPTGLKTDVEPGLLGYVLPGSTMRWTLKPPAKVFSPGGILEVMINGEKTTQALSLDERSP